MVKPGIGTIMEPSQGIGSLEVIENMVAGDGIEPPTPAFSGP